MPRSFAQKRVNARVARVAALFAAAPALLAAGSASAEFGQTLSGFRESPAPIAPSPALGVGHEIFGAVDADTDVVIARGGFGYTFYDGVGEHATLWAEGFGGFGDGDFFGGSIGPSYRARVSQEWAVGASAFFDAGLGDDFLPAVGLGAEAEYIFDETINETLRFGVNGYFAFEEAGDLAEFGDLERAPQTGGDLYARYGQDFDGFRLDLTVGGFYYLEAEDTDDNLGAVGSVGFTYWDGLPEGVALAGHIGPRFMTGGGGGADDDSELSVLGGLQLSYAWGGSTTTTTTVIIQPEHDPARDCAIVHGAYDCSAAVQHDADGETKEGDAIVDDLHAPQPRVETVEIEVPGVRPVEPVRHLGFQTPFSTIAR